MDTFTVKPPIPPHIAEHFRAHSAGGKSAKQYSLDSGISPQTFYTWRKKYLTKKNRIPQFSSIGTISLQQGLLPLFDLHIYGSTKISIYPGATAGELAPFLALLAQHTEAC